MKTAILSCIIFCAFIVRVESAEIGSYAIPLDIAVGAVTIPAGTYTIRVETDAHPRVELLKAGQVIASESAIVLPAAGQDEVTVTIVKSQKQDYVRIRIRNSGTWYIVYLPVSQHSALSTRHS